VVTAGHCFRDFNGVRQDHAVADLTAATVGRADLSGTNGEVATVVAVRQSPTNDLSLAKLDRPITGITPIKLSRRAPAVGDNVRLTGYGSTASVDPTPSTVLRTGQFTVTSVSDSTISVTGLAPQRDNTPCLTTPARRTSSSPGSVRRCWCRWRVPAQAAPTPRKKSRPG
jgi:hypothetical protein